MMETAELPEGHGLPLADRLALFRRALVRSTMLRNTHEIAVRVFGMPSEGRPFGQSAAVAARFRFVEPTELRDVLEQFCRDFEIDDPASVAAMETNRVFHSDIVEYKDKRARYFAPSPVRDALGEAAADFMGVQALSSLFGIERFEKGTPIDVPLVDLMMRRGARGLYKVGRDQFDKLAQIAVDLGAWLRATDRSEVVLIEAPLGNSVPVAVLAHVFRKGGIKVDIVEWGCPRNDRSPNGRTVAESARDLSTIPLVANAPFLLFMDDAITGSRFLKMAKALRKVVGASRLGTVALRVRFNPAAKFNVSEIRDLAVVNGWASGLDMPFGEVILPDLPLFHIDAGAPGLLGTALAWGDTGHAAGKRKVNFLFYFIDRFEAIAKELGKEGPSAARDLLHRHVWSKDTSGAHHMIPDDIGEATHRDVIGALPSDFFDRIRGAAKAAFPHDYFGRAVAGVEEVRRRTDWLKTCISTAALSILEEKEAHFLNRAVTDLSEANYTAGVDNPPRDHDYGLYTLPLVPGEDRLHLELVDLIVADADKRSPRARATIAGVGEAR